MLLSFNWKRGSIRRSTQHCRVPGDRRQLSWDLPLLVQINTTSHIILIIRLHSPGDPWKTRVGFFVCPPPAVPPMLGLSVKTVSTPCGVDSFIIACAHPGCFSDGRLWSTRSLGVAGILNRVSLLGPAPRVQPDEVGVGPPGDAPSGFAQPALFSLPLRSEPLNSALGWHRVQRVPCSPSSFQPSAEVRPTQKFSPLKTTTQKLVANKQTP